MRILIEFIIAVLLTAGYDYYDGPFSVTGLMIIFVCAFVAVLICSRCAKLIPDLLEAIFD